VKAIFKGLVLVFILALASDRMAHLPWLTSMGISPLIVAILLGIFLGNILPHSKTLTPGMQFSAKKVLRTAIVLYGFRVTFPEIASLGITTILLDIFVVFFTLALGYITAKRLFKLDNDLALLISAGSAICGAAAVLAVEDILKSDPYKTSIAIGTVVLFGTISMFLYPALQHAQFFGMSDYQFGIFAGASIHEVAQALIAGSNINAETGNIAVIVKMIRVLLLVPVLFILSGMKRKMVSTERKKLIIPWFALGFTAVIGFNSFQLLPLAWISHINQLDTFLLAMAMAAVGYETKISKLTHVGLRPLYFSFALFLWLLISVSFLVKWI
jgi:uncharacterized integral membrane protein (TIGR00698 family)